MAKINWNRKIFALLILVFAFGYFYNLENHFIPAFIEGIISIVLSISLFFVVRKQNREGKTDWGPSLIFDPFVYKKKNPIFFNFILLLWYIVILFLLGYGIYLLFF